MAGKRNRKALEVKKDSRKALEENEDELCFQRLAYDILYFTLPLCGLPKEMLKCKEIKENSYDDDFYELKVGLIVLHFALSMRDQWKMMFESRFKSSGMGMYEKIDDYLKSFITISRQFQNSNTLNKIQISLAVYNEMMLFLSYKGIEFDFELMIVSWNNLFEELIAPQVKPNEPLQRIIDLPTKLADFTKWMTSFIKDTAFPYGLRDNVSEIFRQNLDKQLKMEVEETLKKRKILTPVAPQTTNSAAARETEPVLSPGFESLVALLGDRECTKNGAHGKSRESKIRSAKPVESNFFKSLGVLPDKFKFSEQPEFCAHKNGVRGKDKESRIRSAKPVGPHGFESSAVLLDKIKFPELPEVCAHKNGVRRKDKESRIRSAKSVEPHGFESSAVLPDKIKFLEPPAVCANKNGVREKDKESRIRSAKPVEPHGFESLAVLPDKNKNPEPPESCIAESGVSGKDKESSIQSTRSKDATVRRRRPTVVEALLESFRRLKMNNQQKNNQKD